MAVSIAVCEIFSIKECCDLKDRSEFVQGNDLEKLEMAQFDRSHTSSYSPFIVTMAIFCIVYIYRYSDLLVENRKFF